MIHKIEQLLQQGGTFARFERITRKMSVCLGHPGICVKPKFRKFNLNFEAVFNNFYLTVLIDKNILNQSTYLKYTLFCFANFLKDFKEINEAPWIMNKRPFLQKLL